MSGVSPLPLFSVQVGLASNPLDNPQVWTEIGTLVEALTIKRGRMHALSTYEPGHATLICNGRGRELDPDNTASTYYPNFDMGKQIQLGFVVNILTLAEAAITGGWTQGTNTTATFASNSMTLKATASGSVSATTPSGTAGFRCLANRNYNYTVRATAGSTARTVTWTVTWYDFNGTSLRTDTVVSAADSTGGVTLSGTTVTSHPQATYASCTLSVAGCAANETHLFTQIGLMDAQIVGTTTTWVTGGPYPLFTGFIDTITPLWMDNSNTTIQIQCTDTLRVLQQTWLPTDAWVARATTLGATAIYPLDDPSGSAVAHETIGGQTGGLTGTELVFGGASRIAGTPATTATITNPSYPVTLGVSIPQAAAVTVGSTLWSIAGWFNCTNASPTFNLFYQTNPTQSRSISFNVTTGTGVVAIVLSDGTSTVSTVSSGNYGDGKWHLAEAVCASGTLTLYVDGFSVGSVSTGGIGVGAWGGYAYIGRTSSSSATSFSESAIAIFNGVDIHAGVATDYQSGINYFTTPAVSGTRFQDVLNFVSFPTNLWAAPGSGSDAGRSNIQAPSSVVGNTAVLPYLQQVAIAENGQVYADARGVVTFTDRYHYVNFTTPTIVFGDQAGQYAIQPHPDVGRDNLDFFQRSVCQSVGGNQQTSESTSAATKYGVKPSLTQTGLISAGGDSEMLGRAAWNVSQFSTATTRVRAITIDVMAQAGSTTDVIPLLVNTAFNGPPQIDLAALVRFSRTPFDTHSGYTGTAFTQNAIVEGIEHEISLDPAHWRMTLRLSPVGLQQFWVLGTSALDTTTKLAY